MSIRERLRADLVSALRARNKTEVSMIRTLIGAIENAESVDVELSIDPKIGLNHDQPRKSLSEDDITRVVTAERDEVTEGAVRYRELGLTEEAEELDLRAQIVDRYLAD